jgi:DNA-binding HxlR family transcriptional regulator
MQALGGKWRPYILHLLCEKPRRFSELRKMLPGISATALTRALKDMEESAFITRDVVHTRPFEVRYSLSGEQNNSVREVIECLNRFGQQLQGSTGTYRPSQKDHQPRARASE